MRKHEKGTTLVELIVSISLFLVVISIMVPTLFTTIRMQRNINGLVRVHNNLAYVTEYISREVRTGTSFEISTPRDTNVLRFKNYHGENVEYSFDGTQKRLTRRVGGGTPVSMFASDVVLNNFQFFLNNSDSVGARQVSVVVLADASPKEGLTEARTQFQTTMTPLLRTDIQ